MAEGKKSVLLYCDLIHTIEKMDDKTAGQFFKHYLRYINDLNPTTENIVVDLTFESVKQNLKRDLKKWEKRAENSRKNGALGGRPKKNPQKPNRLIENPQEPEKPVTDTVTVTVTDTVNVKDINKDIKKDPVFNFRKSLLELGAKEDLVLDFLKVRAKLKASNTETAFKYLKNQINKSKYNVNQIIEVCIVKNWKSFKADWDISEYVTNENQKEILESNEKIIKYKSNVNPTIFELPESKFLEMQKRNKEGGYIYTILN